MGLTLKPKLVSEGIDQANRRLRLLLGDVVTRTGDDLASHVLRNRPPDVHRRLVVQVAVLAPQDL